MANLAPATENDHRACQLAFFAGRLEGMLTVRGACDVSFLVDGDEVHASRSVLGAASEYFEKLLSGEGFKEGSAGQGPIELPGIDKPTFQVCLQYLYCGDPALTSENVLAVLDAADMFGIGPLCTACDEAMVQMLDSTTCLRFLAASDRHPGTTDAVRASCYTFVEESLGMWLSYAAEHPQEVKLLQFGTLLDVCQRIGLGLDGVGEPSLYLGQAMELLLEWGKVHVSAEISTPEALCKEVNSWTADQFLSETDCVWEHMEIFEVARETRRGDGVWLTSVSAFSVYGFDFELGLRSESDFLYPFLQPVVRELLPTWWPCDLVVGFSSSLSRQEGQEVREHGFLDFDLYPAFFGGLDHFICYDDLPHGSISVQVDVRARIVLNSVKSLCSAYALFHPEAWNALEPQSLLAILWTDALHVTSEDEVLERLLELDREPESLEALLSRVRWQFLTPTTFLDTCRTNVKLQRSSIARAALRWLLGHEVAPACNMEGRRASYGKSVRSSRPIQDLALATWILQGGDQQRQPAQQ